MTETPARTREDLEAEIARLTRELVVVQAALQVSMRSNVMCRHRLATTADELAEHLVECHAGVSALVCQEGSADEQVNLLVEQGWTLDPHIEYVAGKRIRLLTQPTGEPLSLLDETPVSAPASPAQV